MSDLIAIGYPDEETALRAMDEIHELSEELTIQPDAVAAIARDRRGHYRVTTTHHPVGVSTSWGLFWGLLFGAVFFVPVLGLAVGAGMGALIGKVAKGAIDKDFADQVRDLVKPGTSALFMVLDKVSPDKVVAGLRPFGGTVLKSSLSKETERELQQALHGQHTVA